MHYISIKNEFELKFPKLSPAVPNEFLAKLGHFNFQAKFRLTICVSISSKFLAIIKIANVVVYYDYNQFQSIP